MSINVRKISEDLEAVAKDIKTINENFPEGMEDIVKMIVKTLKKVKNGTIDTLREQMNAAYKARNLTRLAISGIQIDNEKLLQIAADSLKTVKPIGIDPELIESLAETIFNAQSPKEGETIAITGAKRNIEILEAIARICIRKGVDFVIDISNDEINAILINNANDEGLKRLAKERYDLYEPIKTKLAAYSNPDAKFDQDKMMKYLKELSPHANRIRNLNLAFSFTVVPTKKDAEIDGIEYKEYLKLFFEACDQPWEAIQKAQTKLIEKLDKGKEMKMINKDGTNLTIGIEGSTFINSGADANIPGSEVFSAPEKEKTNGTLVSKGTFKHHGFPLIKNITLEFVNGEIVESHAEEGEEDLKKILATDEGAKFIGEIAFGTNPHLHQHLVNALLVEKIGGSFHLAAGNCIVLPPEGYFGQHANTDNGNRSAIHWDITTLLKEGEVCLDGKVIQKNGIWVDENGDPDPDLAVLNYGWEAMPKNQRPDWWEKRYPNGYED